MRRRSCVTSPRILTASPGPGNGCRMRISSGTPSSLPINLTSSLNSSRKGSINRRFIFSGSPPTLWWLLIVTEGPRTDTDSITSGYKVPCTRKRTLPIRVASSSKTSMKVAPMIFRFASGSITPFRGARKRSLASTPRMLSFNFCFSKASVASNSPSRSSPLLMKRHIWRSPTARCTRAAATEESTPPDRPQIAWPFSPRQSRMRSVCSSIATAGVQSPLQPQISNRKLRRICAPSGVWATSGWNCSP